LPDLLEEKWMMLISFFFFPLNKLLSKDWESGGEQKKDLGEKNRWEETRLSRFSQFLEVCLICFSQETSLIAFLHLQSLSPLLSLFLPPPNSLLYPKKCPGVENEPPFFRFETYPWRFESNRLGWELGGRMNRPPSLGSREFHVHSEIRSSW